LSDNADNLCLLALKFGPEWYNEEGRDMNTKQKQFIQPNWLLSTGMKLFRKATDRNLDISTLVKNYFDKESLSRHNRRINSDPEFNDPDAITNEVISMMLSLPHDSYYPRIDRKNKKWQAMLGIKDQRSRFGHLGEVLLYYKYLSGMMIIIIRDIINSVRQARKTGTIKGTPIYKKVNYMFSRSIANRHGYDKGRHRNPEKHGEDDTFQATFVSKEIELDTTRHDRDTPADTDQIEYKMLYQQTMDIYKRMHRADQLSIRTKVLANTEKISFEAAYRHYEPDFNKAGITTCRGAKKRYASLENRYPELKPIREAMKN